MLVKKIVFATTLAFILAFMVVFALSGGSPLLALLLGGYAALFFVIGAILTYFFVTPFRKN
jgi:hypothetical protein